MKQAAYLHKDEMPESVLAAERIVPIILSLVGSVQSVVDLGGGNGGWLTVFGKHGVDKIHLIDHPDAENELLIEKKYFESVDLTNSLPKMNRFDLALSIECVEHLPANRAEFLVEWLASCSNKVVFSAAIPGQDGKGHINTRLPDYWISLFHKHGLACHDVIRPLIINEKCIPYWYRQNLFLFTKDNDDTPKYRDNFLPSDFLIVHKKVFDNLQNPGFRTLLKMAIPSFVKSFIK